MPDMGPYALYIWLSFAAAAIIMLGMLVVSLRALKRAKQSLAQIQRDHET